MADYTKFKVRYQLDDTDAQNDASMSGENYKAFSDLSSLAEGTNSVATITQEHNFNILDGSLGDEIDTIGFYSQSMSDGDGNFEYNPKIIVDFSNTHSSYMLTFNFVEDSPTKAIIMWYFGDLQIYSMTQEWSGNDTVCTVTNSIEAFDKIVIEFVEALPNRYIKLNHIEFGATLNWDENIIKSGTLVKGADRLSNMLSIDTLTFELVDTTNSMNFGNPNGMHVLFRRNQAMYPVEVLQNGEDVVELPLGKFYLDTFKTDGNIGKISAYSYMGVLDKIQYPGYYIISSVSPAAILEDIFSVIGLTSDEYTISAEVMAQRVCGTVKPMTCREALREVLFACNATIDTTNPDKIQVYRYSPAIISGLDRHSKVYTKVQNYEPVTAVKINYVTYQEGETSEIISELTYGKGIYTVIFDGTYKSISISNARGIHVSAFSATFEVLANNMTVTIQGYKVTETQKSITVSRELKPGEFANIKEFSTTMCDDAQAVDLAQTILDYYTRNTLSIQVQHYAKDISMDGSRSVENPNVELNGFVAAFEQRTFDLTGGFVDTATMLGYYDYSDRYYFATPDNDITEIFAGEDTGII